MCPLLQEYGNIAYSMDDQPNRDDVSASIEMQPRGEKRHKKSDLLKPVMPITSIDMPD